MRLPSKSIYTSNQREFKLKFKWDEETGKIIDGNEIVWENMFCFLFVICKQIGSSTKPSTQIPLQLFSFMKFGGFCMCNQKNCLYLH